MKSKLKKSLSLLLALVMVLSCMSMSAMAEADGVIDTENELVEAVSGGGTVKLGGNVTLDNQLHVEKTVTLDLNGKTISASDTLTIDGGIIVVHRGATLTVIDSAGDGVIDATTTRLDANNKYSAIYSAIQVTAKGEGAGEAAELIVEGGTIKGVYYAVTGNGTRHNTVITISGGKLEGDTAIYHPQDGTLNITGGEIIGRETGIELRAGTLNVSGGTITANGTPTNVTPNGNGTTSTGAGIAVAQHTTKLPINVDINGGTIKGYSAFYESNPQNNAQTDIDKVSVRITGGTLATNNGGEVAVYSQDKTSFISGGTFSSDPSAYVAEGKTVAMVNDNYVVADSLNAIISNAPNGATVKLLNNVTMASNVELAKDLTLDLAGCAITSAADDLFTVKDSGTLTINDTVGGGSIYTDNWTVLTAKGGNVIVNAGKIGASKANTAYKSAGSITFNGGMINQAATYYSVAEGLSTYNGYDENAGYYIYAAPIVTGVSPSAIQFTSVESQQLTATSSQTVTWSSSNESVATVDQNGLVTATGTPGTAVIYAAATNGSYAYSSVTVGDAVVKNTTNNQEYASLQVAFNEATSDDTIQLTSSFTLSSITTIPEGKTLTLDLNGFTLTENAAYDRLLLNKGTLTITGGTIHQTHSDSYGVIANEGKLTLNADVTMTDDGGSGGAIVVNRAGSTLTVLGGEYSATNDNGNCNGVFNILADSTATISNAIVNSNNNTGYGVYSISNRGGTLTLNSNTVEAGRGALANNAGTTTVNSGSYTVTGSNGYYGYWITNDGNDTTVTINGGTFIGPGGGVYAGVDDGGQDESDVAITINGGFFNTTAKSSKETGKVWAIQLKGGYYKTAPADALIADGYEKVSLTEGTEYEAGYRYAVQAIAAPIADTFAGYTDAAIADELSTDAAVEVTPTPEAIATGEANTDTTYVAYKDANQNVVKTSLTVEVVSTENAKATNATIADSTIANALVDAANAVDNKPSKSEVKVADLVKAKALTGGNNDVKLGMSLTLTEQTSNRVTFDIHPTVQVNNGTVETLDNGYIGTSGMTVRMPVPSTWTSVKVYHGSDLVGTYTPVTSGSVTYVEFKGTSFSEYSGEDNSASIGYGAIVYLSGTMGDANSVIIGFDRNPNYPAIGDIQLSIGERVLNPVDSLNAYNNSRVATYMQVEKPDDANSTTATYYKVKVFAKFINTPVTVKLMNGESELSFYSFGYSGFNTQSIVSSYGVSFVDYARLLSVKNATSDEAEYYNAFYNAVNTYGSAIDALVPYLQQAD